VGEAKRRAALGLSPKNDRAKQLEETIRRSNDDRPAGFKPDLGADIWLHFKDKPVRLQIILATSGYAVFRSSKLSSVACMPNAFAVQPVFDMEHCSYAVTVEWDTSHSDSPTVDEMTQKLSEGINVQARADKRYKSASGEWVVPLYPML
jgi:hypothetical protein